VRVDGVAIRIFTDSQGVEWRVWSTVPSNAGSVAPDLRDGWLSFGMVVPAISDSSDRTDDEHR
jgi:hypothetical protein